MTLATRRATPCNDRRPLLNGEIVDLKVPFSLRDNRITSSPSVYPPSEVRMSRSGWCAQSMCTVESESYYLQVDFGAEVVVEAISVIGIYNDALYQVTEYQVEYGSDLNHLYCVTSEESNDNIFAVDVCRGNQDREVKNFTYPVIAQFVRVVLLQWENNLPCLRMELYGCYVKECSQISVLRNESIRFSSLYPSPNMDVWCPDPLDPSPNANLTFTEPHYLLYGLFRGNQFDYIPNFSLTYESLSGEKITYTNVDGFSFFGGHHVYNFGDDRTVLLWTPINTSQIQLNVDDTTYNCIGIDFYGCTEVIDHEFSMMETTTETSNPISCAVRPVQCSCTDQQQTSASSSSDSNVVIITVPIVVLFGVIIVIVIVVIAILIWKKTNSRSDTLPYENVSPATAAVVNDLYGMKATLNSKSLENNNETSDNGAQDNRKDSVKYEYATVTQPNQPTVTYETVSLHEEDGTRSSNKAAASNVYSEPSDLHSDPEL